MLAVRGGSSRGPTSVEYNGTITGPMVNAVYKAAGEPCRQVKDKVIVCKTGAENRVQMTGLVTEWIADRKWWNLVQERLFPAS
jgi:hypothetical protein